MKTTHKEKLYLNEHNKKQLGAMIRWLRLQAGWTQQQLVDKVGILSLRTLISLEQGKIVKDDDIYDTLLDQFALSFNYTHPMDKHIEQMLSAMLSAYAHYDDEAMERYGLFIRTSLPLPVYKKRHRFGVWLFFMAGVERIELPSAVLETVILPLYYTPKI